MILKRLLFLLVFATLGLPVMANHVLGGNITWECLGGNQYEVTFTMYKDCYGTPGDPVTESFFFFPNGCAAVPFSVDLDYVSAVEISDLCATEFASSSCSGGLAPGTMQVTYSGIVTLDAGCTWEAIWNNGSWNYFENMDNFNGLGDPITAYISSEINTAIPCDDSIDITSTLAAPQIPYLCYDDPYVHNIVVPNPNGYTLTYSLGNCLTAGATIDNPINAPGGSIPPGLTINPVTGVITWDNAGPPNITSFGNYVLCVEIVMMDGANYIGTVYETLVFVVRNCTPTNTDFVPDGVSSVGAYTTQLNATTVEVCAGDTLQFSVTAENADVTKAITLTPAAIANNPGFVFAQSGSNPAVGTFTLVTTGPMTVNSPYTITVNAVDNACPNPDTDAVTITVHIRPNVELNFEDSTICLGDNVNLVASGLSGNNYSWFTLSPVAGPFGNGNPTQTVSPTETTVYRVYNATVPAQCQDDDTLTVHVSLTGVDVVVADETCGNVNGSLTANTLGDGSGNYNYDWSCDAGTNDPQSLTGLNGGLGACSVTVTDNVYGCTATGSGTVNDVTGPSLSLGNNITYCDGGNVTLTFDVISGTLPFNIVWAVGSQPTGAPAVVNNDNQTLVVNDPGTDTWTITQITDATGCIANINESIDINERLLVTTTLTPSVNDTICVGDNLTINTSFSLAGTYDIEYQVGANAPVIGNNMSNGGLSTINLGVQNTAGPIVVDVNWVEYDDDNPSCPSSDVANTPITVQVLALPTATISGGTTICNNACQNLTITCTGLGPWVINYTLNGVAQAVLNSAISPFVFNVCPTVATSQYCITSVTDANCTNSTVNSCTTVTMLPAYTVTAFTSTDYNLCPGEQATLNITVPGTGNYCIGLTDTPEGTTVPDTDLCTQPAGVVLAYNVQPTVTTDYCITDLYPDAYAACASNPALCLTIAVNDTINVVQTSITCNDTVTPYEYQVVYTLSGGSGVYDEMPGGSSPNGVLAGNTFTSPWTDTGTAVHYTFSDNNNCDNDSVYVLHNCPVITNAGTMSNVALSLCGVTPVGGTFGNNQILDGNDDIMWVLCTDSLNPLGTMVGIPGNPNATSATFTPVFPAMAYGTEYFIVAVAGDGIAGGLVNQGLNAPYIDFSSAQPVTWYQVPSATISTLDNTVCTGQSVVLDIEFVGTGLFDIQVGTPSGVLDFNTVEDDTTITVNVAGDYDLNFVTSGPGGLCNGVVNGLVNVIINPLPTAVFSASDTICQGQQHCFDITFEGTGPWTFVEGGVGADLLVGTNNNPYQYCVTGAGNYFIDSVTDANCTNTTNSPTVSITVNQLPTVTWTQATASFCEGNCVNIELDLVGTGPMTPDFDPTNPAPALSEAPATDNTASAIYSVCAPGDYEVLTVTDANGCVSAVGDIITVTEIALPVANAGSDQEACVDETISIGTAGAAGVTYAWAPTTNMVAPTTTAIVDVTSASAFSQTYTVTATTTVGNCQATDDVDVEFFALPSLVLTADPDSLCAGDCTTLTASGADVYVWDSGNSFPGGPGAVVVVCPDTIAQYNLTGTQNHPLVSCSATDSIMVYAGEPLDTLIDYTEEVCFGTCDGEIHITVSGGFAPYEVTGDITSLDVIDLCPGIYNYTIIDNIGCSISGSLEIEERAPEAIDQIIITNPTCEYELGCIEVIDNTTSIFISGCGMSETVFDSNALFCGLEDCCYTIETIFEVAPGVYCSTQDTACVDNISPDVNFNAVWTQDTFCFDAEVCFAAVPDGGTAGLQVDWFADIDLQNQLSAANPWCFNIVQDSAAYGVAEDQLGCFSDTVLVEAFLFPEITLEITNGEDSVYICQYDDIELIAVEGGGNGNIQLDWYELPNNIQPFSDNDTVSVTPALMAPLTNCYLVEAQDYCSAMQSDTLCVVLWDTPEVIFAVDTMEGCWPLEVEFYDLTDSIADAVTCFWDFDDGNNANVCDTVVNIYSTPTLYAEFFPSLTITTENGCVGSDTLADPIILHGYPEVDFTWEPQPVTVLEHDSIQMINLTEGAESYLWNFYGNETSTAVNPAHTFPMLDQGIFPVCLTATTEYGCADTLCQDILVEAVLGVFVPNTFTPDGDGINDIFLPVVTGYKDGTYRFWIFNRWGDPLFYSEDPEAAWTGGSDGGEYYVNQDVYVWRLEVEALFDGKIEVYEGHVSILR